MTTIALMRRSRLGSGSAAGLGIVAPNLQLSIQNWLNGSAETTIDDSQTPSLVVRWGWTGTLPQQLSGIAVMNRSEAIHQVNDKMTFAHMVDTSIDGELPVLTSESWSEHGATVSSAMERLSSRTQRWVLRAKSHSQGRRMYKVYPHSIERVLRKYARVLGDGWYMRPRILKAAEYRVYVMCGKVVHVARKTPGDPNKTAWNVARGGRFDPVNWDNWPLDVCDKAVKAFNVSRLHFGGVDVMVEEGTNTPYFIEINTAPSLPLTSTGGHTTRHEAMAKGFKWHAENGLDHINPDAGSYEGWRKYIHPAVWGNHTINNETRAA